MSKIHKKYDEIISYNDDELSLDDEEKEVEGTDTVASWKCPLPHIGSADKWEKKSFDKKLRQIVVQGFRTDRQNARRRATSEKNDKEHTAKRELFPDGRYLYLSLSSSLFI